MDGNRITSIGYDELTTRPLPDGIRIERAGGEQVIFVGEGSREYLRAYYGLSDPEILAEDLRSLSESAPLVIRYQEHGEPVICECCGAIIVAVPEAEYGPEGRGRWRRGVWEKASLRKHTQRRCNWLRAGRLGVPA